MQELALAIQARVDELDDISSFITPTENASSAKVGRRSGQKNMAMVDLVGTCPKDFWLEWIAEGDAAGDPPTGEEWGWYTRDRLALQAKPGDRFYIVAHGLLRGWAPVTRVHDGGESFIICRHAGAVACTVATPIPGFRGLRTRWWNREAEIEFPDWKTVGLPAPKRKMRSGGEKNSAPLLSSFLL